MRRSFTMAMALALSFMTSEAWSQSTARRGQIELYAGAAFPMAPETFKEYYKVGISGHAQYVMFPSPRMGLSFTAGYESFMVDNAAIENDLAQTFQMLYGISPSAAGVTFNAEGSASVIELGVGLRPYLTAPQAHTQFFLFGMGTYNIIKDEAKASISGPPPIGNASVSATNKPRKFGVAAGAGLELPAGESFNIVLQGVFRFIFTDIESSNFLGVTGGLVF